MKQKGAVAMKEKTGRESRGEWSRGEKGRKGKNREEWSREEKGQKENCQVEKGWEGKRQEEKSRERRSSDEKRKLAEQKRQWKRELRQAERDLRRERKNRAGRRAENGERRGQKGRTGEAVQKEREKGTLYDLPFTRAGKEIPIKAIKEGIIYTEDGRYVKILEVLPINFLHRSASEQRNIIYSFIVNTMKAVGVYVPKKGNGAALAAVIGVTSVGAGAGVAGYAHYRKKRRIGAA